MDYVRSFNRAFMAIKNPKFGLSSLGPVKPGWHPSTASRVTYLGLIPMCQPDTHWQSGGVVRQPPLHNIAAKRPFIAC